jgi:hypothetical protein
MRRLSATVALGSGRMAADSEIAISTSCGMNIFAAGAKSWEGHLLAVPYPNSRCEIRRFPYPREADIVGRVTMRLAESHG